MAKYRKKPVVIEAIQYVGSNGPEIYDFCRTVIFECGVLIIHTLEGDMKVDVGDFVIKGVKGEFSPCKPDLFAATYEVVEKEPPRHVLKERHRTAARGFANEVVK